MKTTLITILFILISLSGYSQKTEVNTDFLPVQYVESTKSVKLDTLQVNNFREKGLNIMINMVVNPDNLGYFEYHNENNDTYLLNISGTMRSIPPDWNLIAPLKNNKLMITDRRIEKTEVIHYRNIRIVDGEGKEVPTKDNLSNYIITSSFADIYTSYMGETYVKVFNPSTANTNLVNGKGEILFKNDLSSLVFLFDDFISMDETDNSQTSVFRVKTKKYIELDGYTYIRCIPQLKLLIYKSISDGKFCLYDPFEEKILFENKNEPDPIIQKDRVVKDFFKLTVSSNSNGYNWQVVDRNGKDVLPGDYRKILFESNTLKVYDDDDRYQIYDLVNKEFLLPYYVKKIEEKGDFTFTLKDKFYIVTNRKSGEQVYDESDMVTSYYERGNLFAIERQKSPDSKATTTDIYSTSKSKFIFKNISSLNSINYSTNGSPSSYQLISVNEPSPSDIITDKNGNVIIPNIYIDWKIQYNPTTQTFETINKKGKIQESYDMEGNKLKK